MGKQAKRAYLEAIRWRYRKAKRADKAAEAVAPFAWTEFLMF